MSWGGIASCHTLPFANALGYQKWQPALEADVWLGSQPAPISEQPTNTRDKLNDFSCLSFLEKCQRSRFMDVKGDGILNIEISEVLHVCSPLLITILAVC